MTFFDWFEMNWNAGQLILDIVAYLPIGFEDGGVRVRCTLDNCIIIHDDGRKFRYRVGVGGKEVGQDHDQDHGLGWSESHGHGLWRREPEVALVILFNA